MVSSKCYAKINLYLKVLGRREDGFHDLDTVFQAINLHDDLHWEPADEPLRLTVEGAAGALLEDTQRNLVVQAARRFDAYTGQRSGGPIRLVKRIPAGGGLGGGSSDAAAMLRLLNDHYQNPLTRQQMAELALACGSDVPFFLVGGCQRGRGRGEHLTPMVSPACPAGGFLILPPIHLGTADVFRHFAQTGQGVSNVQVDQPAIGENDLFPAALAVAPKLAVLWQALTAVSQGATLFMTGSGSTLVWLTDEASLPSPVEQVLTTHGASWLPFRFRSSRDTF